jgi:hypothetical protein
MSEDLAVDVDIDVIVEGDGQLLPLSENVRCPR